MPALFVQFQLTYIIVALLSLAGIVALILQFGNAVRYRDAINFIAPACTLLNGRADEGFLTRVREAVKKKAPTLSARLLGITKCSGRMIILQHIESIVHQKQPLQPALLSEITDAREQSRFRCAFPSLVISAALILGLGGTFVAFSQLIYQSGLGQVISQPASLVDSDLISSFKTIYAGFGQAFISSLTGIFTTIGLLVVSLLFVGPRREKLLAELEEATGTILAPAVDSAPNLARDLAISSERAAALIEQAGTTTLHLSKLTSELGRLTCEVQESIGANSQLADALRQVQTQLASTEARWSKLLDALDGSRLAMASTVEAAQRQTQQNIEFFRASVDQAFIKLGDFAEKVKAEINRVSTARMDHLDNIDVAVRDGWEQTLAIWQTKSNTLLDEIRNAATSIHKELHEREQNIAGRIDAALGNIQTAWTKATDQTVAAINRVIGEMQGTVKATQADQNAGTVAFEQRIDRLTEAVEKLYAVHLRQAPSPAPQETTQALDRVLNSLTTSTNQLTRSTPVLRQLPAEFTRDLEEAHQLPKRPIQLPTTTLQKESENRQIAPTSSLFDWRQSPVLQFFARLRRKL